MKLVNMQVRDDLWIKLSKLINVNSKGTTVLDAVWENIEVVIIRKSYRMTIKRELCVD